MLHALCVDKVPERRFHEFLIDHSEGIVFEDVQVELEFHLTDVLQHFDERLFFAHVNAFEFVLEIVSDEITYAGNTKSGIKWQSNLFHR